MGNKESKAQVRKLIDDLIQSKDEASQRSMWRTIIDSKVSPDVVSSAFLPSDVDTLRKQNYGLYIDLILNIIEYMSSFASSLDGQLFPNEVTSVSVCAKMLQRLLPALLSLPRVCHHVLWLNKKPKGCSEEEVIKEVEGTGSGSASEELKGDTSIETPHGARLIQALINLLFKQNYTISVLAEEEKSNMDPFGIDIKTVWSKGLQYDDTRQNKERRYDGHRCDILYLILACLMSQLYLQRGESYNLFALYATNGKAQNIKNFFFSILNTVLTYDWKGYGIPYVNVKAGDYDNLADLSLQILCVLIEYTPPPEDKITDIVRADPAFKGIIRHLEGFWKMDVPVTVFSMNEFMRLLSRVEGQPNYKALFDGFSRLLSNYVSSKNTSLPNSVKELTCFNELIIFLLRLLIINPVISSLTWRQHFLLYVMLREDLKQLLSPLLYILDSCLADDNLIQLSSTVTFILLSLSSRTQSSLTIEPEFGAFLATPYSEDITFKVPLFRGNYGDLLMLLLHKGLQMPHVQGSTLRQSFFSILYNVSPFLKQLSIQSVMSIFHMISLYSGPQQLLSGPESFAPLKLVLDSLLNILTYNYESNALLAFALLNQSKKYLKLAEYKLADLAGKPESSKEEEKGAAQSWVPTEQWFEEHKAQLPLKMILGLLASISSKLEQAYLDYEATEEEVMELLKKISLIGIQEDIQKFSFLHYASNPAVEGWLSGYLWKVIYLKNTHMQLFIPSRIRYIELQPPKEFKKESKSAEGPTIEKPKDTKQIQLALINSHMLTRIHRASSS